MGTPDLCWQRWEHNREGLGYPGGAVTMIGAIPISRDCPEMMPLPPPEHICCLMFGVGGSPLHQAGRLLNKKQETLKKIDKLAFHWHLPPSLDELSFLPPSRTPTHQDSLVLDCLFGFLRQALMPLNETLFFAGLHSGENLMPSPCADNSKSQGGRNTSGEG